MFAAYNPKILGLRYSDSIPNRLTCKAVNVRRTVRTSIESIGISGDFDSAMRRFEPSRPSQSFRAFCPIHSDSIWCLILTLGHYLFAKLVSSSAPLNETAALAGGCDALKLRSFDVDACCRRRLVGG